MRDYILIVDDDEGARRLLTRILKKEGYETREAAYGEEAIRMMEEDAPMLVLLDLMMPVTNGFDVIQYMQGSDAHRGIPVVAITAMEVNDPQVIAHEAGITQFLQKGGYTAEDLMEKVQSALSEANQQY